MRVAGRTRLLDLAERSLVASAPLVELRSRARGVRFRQQALSNQQQPVALKRRCRSLQQLRRGQSRRQRHRRLRRRQRSRHRNSRRQERRSRLRQLFGTFLNVLVDVCNARRRRRALAASLGRRERGWQELRRLKRRSLFARLLSAWLLSAWLLSAWLLSAWLLLRRSASPGGALIARRRSVSARRLGRRERRRDVHHVERQA